MSLLISMNAPCSAHHAYCRQLTEKLVSKNNLESWIMSFKESEAFKNLQKKAEDLAHSEPHSTTGLNPEELNRVLHDLRVHQIELEIQNEELRESQANLLESKQRLQSARDHFYQLYHKSPVGYVVVDKTGIIQQANQTFASMTGITLDLVEGRPLLNHIAQQDHKTYLSQFRSFFNDPSGKRLELRLSCIKDKTHYVAMEGRLIDWPELTEDSNNGHELLVTISDINQSKLAEERLRAAKNLSEKANKAKSEFLSRMSHELRTPLNAIIGFAQLLQLDEDGFSKDHQEAIFHILESGNHLLHLINQQSSSQFIFLPQTFSSNIS